MVGVIFGPPFRLSAPVFRSGPSLAHRARGWPLQDLKLRPAPRIRYRSAMTSKTGYGQYCPIAVAAEVLCTRWTPLVIRALCMGATRYSEIRQSVPLMSTALLSRRLRELEDAGILLRRRNADGRG